MSGILTRTIKYDTSGKVISDTTTNHISGKTYPTPKRKEKPDKTFVFR